MYIKKITIFTSVLAIIALSVGFIGCERIAPMIPDGEMPEMMDEDITIGVVVSLTGKDAQPYGLPMKRGFIMARDEINNAMHGSGSIKFILEDDKSSEEGAIAAVQRLVDRDVPAIVGIAISDYLEDAFPVAQDAGVVAFSSVSSAAGLSKEVGDFAFRAGLATDILIPNGVITTHAILGYQNVAVIYDELDRYSGSVRDELKKALEASGVTILTEETFKTEETTFTQQLTNIKNLETQPDALFIAALAQEMTEIIKQGREIGIPDSVRLIVPDLTNTEVQKAGDAAEGAITFTGWSNLTDTPGNQTFIQNYLSKYGHEPGPWAAQSYATLKILAAAIAKAQSTDSTAIRDALAETMDFPTLLGKTGNFSFDPNGEALYEEIVLAAKDGELQVFSELPVDEMQPMEVPTVTIGIAVDQSGDNAEPYGLPMKRGLDLARDEINMLGHVNIMFEYVDAQGTVEGGVAAVQELVKFGVPVIIGIGISTHLEQAFPIANDAEVVAISPISSAAGLSSLGKYIFRIGLATNILTPTGIMVTQEKLGYQNVAMIYDEADTYSTSSYQELKKALEANNVTILSTETFKTKDTDFRMQLTNIMNLDPQPDALFIAALSGEMIEIIKQGREVGIPDSVDFVVPDLTNAEAEAAGAAAEGAVAFAGWSNLFDTPGNTDFIQNYMAEYNREPEPWAAQAYATLYILANAIAKAESIDSDAIQDALAQTMDLPTILGNFSFDPNGEAMYDRIDERIALIVNDGKLQILE
ncbi:MAG: ABC transporter substrate-binding protein [Candidatus Poribacteria bacterium]|nr:ABC transporter substrate-binding protein [Candidatus Poribacteria bacterium]